VKKTIQARFIFVALILIALAASYSLLYLSGGRFLNEFFFLSGVILLSYLAGWPGSIIVVVALSSGFLYLEYFQGELIRSNYWIEIGFLLLFVTTGLVSGYLSRLFKDLHVGVTQYVRRIEELEAKDQILGTLSKKRAADSLELELQRARRYNHQLALLLISIDGFQELVKNFGVDEGKRILLRVSEIIAESIRGVDIASRHGEDHFSVILPETSLNGAMVVAERIRHGVEETKIETSLGIKLKVTASIAVAMFPDDAITNRDLITLAERVLKKCMEEGGNRFRSSRD
jgi:diguanylate cyclase (GGDEF)-like protein